MFSMPKKCGYFYVSLHGLKSNGIKITFKNILQSDTSADSKRANKRQQAPTLQIIIDANKHQPVFQTDPTNVLEKLL